MPKDTTTATETKGWTVLVYMAAAKDDGLTEPAAIRDLEELQKVESLEDDVKVLVQIDRLWPPYPQRYRVIDGVSRALCDPSLQSVRNMSSGGKDPLRDFVAWGRTYAPSRYYLLVLWGHAFGLGFGRDHDDALMLPELRIALEEAGGVDLLGTNACAMSYAEAAYELSGVARYLVAPEITMPFAGWPYSDIVRAIADNPDIAPGALGVQIVDLFVESFSNKGVALTLVDLARARELPQRVQNLTEALKEASTSSDTTQKQIAGAFLDTAYGDVRPLVDLYDLCANLDTVDAAAVKKHAKAIRDLLLDKNGKLIAYQKSDPELEGLRGLGIYAPAVTGAADLTRLELNVPAYRNLALSRDTKFVWSDFAFNELKELLAPANASVVEIVKNAGVATRDDRTGVAQLLVGINRAYARFDETYGEVKDILGGLVTPAPAKQAKGRKSRVPAALLARNGNGHHYLRLLNGRTNGSYATNGSAPKSKPRAKSAAAGAATTARVRDGLTGLLRGLEDELARLEKTTRRVITHGRLGLGETSFKPGLGDDLKPGFGDDLKPGFGDDLKPGFGDDLKPGFGDDLKPGFGLVPWLMFRDNLDLGAAGDGRVLAQVFGQIARTLSDLEAAVAKLETAALMEGTFNPASSPDQRESAQEEVGRSFRELEDALKTAKDMTSWALLHPTYGLGPGREPGLHPMVRQQLAIASGLGPRSLRLL